MKALQNDSIVFIFLTCEISWLRRNLCVKGLRCCVVTVYTRNSSIPYGIDRYHIAASFVDSYYIYELDNSNDLYS
jgi:hypothetical protein